MSTESVRPRVGGVQTERRIFGGQPDPVALRRRIVQLCFVIFWLLIFEGALRKWVLPAYASALFFVRDPFVLWVYLLALRGPRPLGWRPLAVGCLVGAAFLYLALAQVLLGYSTPVVAAYGMHTYFLFFPLAWVMYT